MSGPRFSGLGPGCPLIGANISAYAQRLDDEELADWRAGRNAVYQLYFPQVDWVDARPRTRPIAGRVAARDGARGRALARDCAGAARRQVVGFDSWRKIDPSLRRPLCASTNRSDLQEHAARAQHVSYTRPSARRAVPSRVRARTPPSHATTTALNRQSMSFNPMRSSTVGKPRNAPLLSGFQPPKADPRSVAVRSRRCLPAGRRLDWWIK
jgi:hypothetical protein